jgi:hypothetical protein
LRISFGLRLRHITFVLAQRQCGEKVVDLAFNPDAFATNDACSGKPTLLHHFPDCSEAESDPLQQFSFEDQPDGRRSLDFVVVALATWWSARRRPCFRPMVGGSGLAGRRPQPGVTAVTVPLRDLASEGIV